MNLKCFKSAFLDSLYVFGFIVLIVLVTMTIYLISYKLFGNCLWALIPLGFFSFCFMVFSLYNECQQGCKARKPKRKGRTKRILSPQVAGQPTPKKPAFSFLWSYIGLQSQRQTCLAPFLISKAHIGFVSVCLAPPIPLHTLYAFRESKSDFQGLYYYCDNFWQIN